MGKKAKSRVIAITNRKGGIGKTTTAAVLACGLQERGFKVLAIDLDGQHNLSDYAEAETTGKTILEALLRECSIKDAIQEQPLFDIVASNESIDNIDKKLNAKDGNPKTQEAMAERVCRLKRLLALVQSSYDYIILDTPPAMSMTTIMSMAAADSVIIPTEADIFSLSAIEKTFDIIGMIKSQYNKGLKVAAILLVKVKNNTVLGRSIAEELEARRDRLDKSIKIYNGIREGVAIREAIALNQSLFQYAPKAKPTKDYNEFIDYIIGGKNQ